MNEIPDSQEPSAEKVVEEALRSFPMAVPPNSLSASIMQQVRANAAQSPLSAPAYRPVRLDYLFGGFFTGLILLMIVIGGALPPELDLYLRMELTSWRQYLELQAMLIRIGSIPQALIRSLAAVAVASGAVAAWLALLLLRQRRAAFDRQESGVSILRAS